MSANETKFVTKIKTLLKAGKVPAPMYFKIGQECGLKCKEVVALKKEHFSDQTKASPAPKAAKKVNDPNRKSPPAKKLTADQQLERALSDQKVIMGTDLSLYGKVSVEDNSAQDGVVVDTPDAFVWIASPEEIADTKDLHKTNY